MGEPDYFQHCRVCMKPVGVLQMTSLFDGQGEKAKAFQEFTGIDISSDKGVYDALICNSCSNILDNAMILKTRLKEAEKYYFEPLREAHNQAQAMDETSEDSGNQQNPPTV